MSHTPVLCCGKALSLKGTCGFNSLVSQGQWSAILVILHTLRARWGLRTYVGEEEWERGESLWERHSHVGPSGKQEYSSFDVMEESEVDGQCFILERCCHWGIPLRLTVVGVVRMTRWGLVHWGPSSEGRRSLKRTRSPGLTEVVMGPSVGWAGSGLHALKSSLRRLR
jgi:hypothetical protein